MCVNHDFHSNPTLSHSRFTYFPLDFLYFFLQGIRKHQDESGFLVNLLITTTWGYTEGVHSLGGGQFILHPCSHFEKQHFKNSKILVCSALIFNIHIFRFETDAGLQVDIESKFFLFNCFSFYLFGEFRGSSKPSSL